MDKITTILLDDEPLALQSLDTILKKYCHDIEVVAKCKTIDEAYNKITQINPDLLILDIHLQEGTSFELLKRLPVYNFEIIFLSAHSQYAIKAIKFNALDYLLKPLDLDEIKEAVQRVKTRLQNPRPNKSLEAFVQNSGKSNDRKIITLPTIDSIEFIEILEIIRCKADGSYTEFYTKKGKIVVSKNIKRYEELLEDYDFFRPHQSFLVNRKYIVKFIKSDGGIIIMSDGEKIPVSKRRRKAFVEWIKQGQF